MHALSLHQRPFVPPLWTLEEMGLDYKLVMLPFPPPRILEGNIWRSTRSAPIPTLFDDEMRMTESSGICHYLATKHGPSPLAVDLNEADYGPG